MLCLECSRVCRSYTPLLYVTDLLIARRVIERVHAKMLQFAIYGRAKATVLIRKIPGYLEGFNVQIDDCLALFAVHPPCYSSFSQVNSSDPLNR